MKHYKTSFLQDTHSYLLNPFDRSRYQQGKRQAVCSIFRNERPGSAEELSMIVHPYWPPHKYIEWSSESSWSFWNRWWIKPYHWTVIFGPALEFTINSKFLPKVCDTWIPPQPLQSIHTSTGSKTCDEVQPQADGYTLLVLGFNQPPNHIVYCNKLQYIVLVCYIYLIWFHM